MARPGGAADGQGVRELLDGAVPAGRQQLDDPRPVGIARPVERVAGERVEADCRDGSRNVTVAGMRSYESEASIQAHPEAIWAVLTDAAGYADWDSGVERVEGTIAPGETIKVHSEASPGRAFPVKAAEF